MNLENFDFRLQFSFSPLIEEDKLPTKINNFIFCGMGGSRLAGLLFKILKPDIPFNIHSNYGLPNTVNPRSLFIANSHSGNTEETIDALEAALHASLPTIIISTGGKLFSFAESMKLPRILLPKNDLPPRFSTGYHLKALMAVMNKEDILSQASKDILQSNKIIFHDFSQDLKGKIPIIYSSQSNMGLAYFWKIHFNETAKVPAFFNTLPEVNHNEINGLNKDEDLDFLNKFHFIFLEDQEDRPEIAKRFSILSNWLRSKNYPVERIILQGINSFDKMITNMNQAITITLALAEIRQQEPFPTPAIDDFKKMIK